MTDRPVDLSGAERLEIAGQTVPRHYGDAAAEYRAARAGAVVVARSHEGRVRAVGRDRLDLLHRMSTNDLRTWRPATPATRCSPRPSPGSWTCCGC